MSPVDAPHTTYLWMSFIGVAFLLAWILWFALKPRKCVMVRVENPNVLKNRQMWARFVSKTLAKHRMVAANYEREIGEHKILNEVRANHERVIGELKHQVHQVTTWARFVSRTLAEDRARFDEIAYLKNEVQLLKRKLKCSWTREEVLNEKMRQCEASGAFVLFHSLNASAFARESDADELDLELPVLRTRSTPV